MAIYFIEPFANICLKCYVQCWWCRCICFRSTAHVTWPSLWPSNRCYTQWEHCVKYCRWWCLFCDCICFSLWWHDIICTYMWQLLSFIV